MVNNVKWLMYFLLIFLIASCSKESTVVIESQANTVNDLNIQTTKKSEQKPLVRLKKPSGQIKLPTIKRIGEFVLMRNSDIKDEKGWMLPPYENAEIKMSFSFAPQIGENVTIVPLKTKIEPFQLAIAEVTKSKNVGCGVSKEKEFYWSVTLETITDKEILEVEPISKGYKNEMPFSIFAIYPSVDFAKSLDKSAISKTNLPKNVSLKRVESAIDLDNDNKPDLLSVDFCCGEPEKESAENCPYVCKKYYKKNNGVWVIFDIHDFQEMC